MSQQSVQVAVVGVSNAAMLLAFCNVFRHTQQFVSSHVASELHYVAPDLDLGREIKYSGTLYYLCPCTQMSGWQLQLRLDRFLTHPFLFIASNYYTIQHYVAWVSESVVK
jgi:hypothetical protein